MSARVPRITPFLWFDSNAEEAVEFYLSIFNNSRRLDELPNNGESPAPNARVLTVSFELDGQRITAMNGGPGHPLTDAFSLVVRCDSQKEIDDYWARLTEGGERGAVRLAERQVRTIVAGGARQSPRAGEASEGDAGADEDGQARYRGAGTRSSIVVQRYC